MIDHTGIKAADPAKSRAFYEKALAPLGYRVMMEIPKEHTGGIVVFGMGVAEGAPKEKLHIAFRAENHAQVDAFYKEAIAAGGTDNGPPGPRPHYHAGYYGAFVLDPDGHNIEAVCHGS